MTFDDFLGATFFGADTDDAPDADEEDLDDEDEAEAVDADDDADDDELDDAEGLGDTALAFGTELIASASSSAVALKDRC